jgi:hypothetical protein
VELLEVDLSRPWSLTFTVAFAGPAPAAGGAGGAGGGCECRLFLGQEYGRGQNAVAVILNDASGGDDHAMVSLQDDQGHDFRAVVPFAFGPPPARHQVRITWDGTIQRAFLDGVQVAQGTLLDPATLYPAVTLWITGDVGGGAENWTIYDFEMRFGGA